MDGLMIFDQQNDIIFKKFNESLQKRIVELLKGQKLVDEQTAVESEIDRDVLVQFFTPMIASQRIMFCQFDNSYTSFQCEDNLNFVFEEFLGYLFLRIGNDPTELMERYLGVSISFIKHLCGPDIYLLKSSPEKARIFSQLLDDWSELYRNDEAILVEGVEHLLINLDLKRVAHKALEAATENLKRDPYSQRSHGILFVKNKLLSIYSSRQAQELSTADIIFLQIYGQRSLSTQNNGAPTPGSTNNVSALNSINSTSNNSTASKKIDTKLIFLQGNINGPHAGCIPHIVHICLLDEDVTLMLVIEYGNLTVSSSLFDVFFAIHKIRILQMQNDMDNLRPAYENLDHYVKQSMDAIKKVKYNNIEIEAAIRKFASKWDFLRRKYLELFKNMGDSDIVPTIESNVPLFVDVLKELFRLICIECNILEYGLQRVAEISNMVEHKLMEIAEFLRVKATQNVVLGSVFKDINGLVHFIHINRTNGRVIAPIIDTSDKRGPLIKKQVWKMVHLSRSYLQKGHMSLIWQDDAFYYSYFLWFEDANGSQIKPKELPNTTSATTVKPQVVPGILAGEYYQWLIETCFPKNNNKIKCFELYSMYVGLTSAQTLLDFNRRLVAILRDNITGFCGPTEIYN